HSNMKDFISNVPMVNSDTSSPEVFLEGKKVIKFISNSYMGLGAYPKVK
ncbi:hypothetical protein MHK_011017, partial [Candidatus Magnetomorum sp. HK-1]